jgi:glycosyltransferase involved in cell wall biosynthesis
MEAISPDKKRGSTNWRHRMSRHKVLVVRPGIHTLDEQFCSALCDAGFKVTLAAPAGAYATSSRFSSHKYEVVQLPAISFGPFRSWPIAFRIRYLFERGDFDFVHVSEEYLPISVSSWLVASRKGIPVFFTIEKYTWPGPILSSLIFRFLRTYLSPFLVKQSAGVLAHSRAAKLFLDRALPESQRQKVIFVPVGVDTSLFYPAQPYRRKKRTLKIICVARFIAHKDHITLLDAMSHLEHHGLDYSVTMVGEGPLKPRIENLAKTRGLEKRVTFISKIKYESLRNLYVKHDVLVLPSRRETVGLVILEAMACGLPVVVSNVGGMSDYMSDGKNGYVFRCGDSADLAQKILAFRSEVLLKRFSSASIQLVRNKFAWSKVIPKYARLMVKYEDSSST